MKARVDNALRKLSRAGFTVRESDHVPGIWYAERNSSRKYIELHRNGPDRPGVRVATISIQRKGENADPLTDYYPGTFVESIAQAIRWCD